MTAGRYVGVAPPEVDDDFDFEAGWSPRKPAQLPRAWPDMRRLVRE